MINPKNQEEFKSLGIETVRRREDALPTSQTLAVLCFGQCGFLRC